MDQMNLGVPLEHVSLPGAGAQLHAVLAGPRHGLPVVLLHGFPEFWYGWRHQIAPLAQAGLRVIVPDLRGYNLSDKPRAIDSYAPNRLQEDVLALLDALDIGRARLVGHDWGGLLAWWLAEHFPGRLEQVTILNAPHPRVFQQTLRRHPSQQLRSLYLLFFQLPYLPEQLLGAGRYFWLRKALTATSRGGTFSEIELAHYEKAWARPDALRGMLNWYRGVRRAPPDTAGRRIQVPLLLIWGERDIALRATMARESVTLCEHGRLVTLPDAGHWLHHEEPRRVNALLLEFLQAAQATPAAL